METQKYTREIPTYRQTNISSLFIFHYLNKLPYFTTCCEIGQRLWDEKPTSQKWLSFSNYRPFKIRFYRCSPYLFVIKSCLIWFISKKNFEEVSAVWTPLHNFLKKKLSQIRQPFIIYIQTNKVNIDSFDECLS